MFEKYIIYIYIKIIILHIIYIYSGGQSTQIKYLSKSTDTYTKILLQ